jgi:hypothetical protein
MVGQIWDDCETARNTGAGSATLDDYRLPVIAGPVVLETIRIVAFDRRDHYALGFPRLFRIESPRISIR